jgi:hypothetical protein
MMNNKTNAYYKQYGHLYSKAVDHYIEEALDIEHELLTLRNNATGFTLSWHPEPKVWEVNVWDGGKALDEDLLAVLRTANAGIKRDIADTEET